MTAHIGNDRLWLEQLLKRVGILYHPKIARAGELADELSNLACLSDASFWLCSAWDEEEAKKGIEGTDVVITIGGDGTILRAARAIAPRPVPILGINLGRFGFMSELGPEEALERAPGFLAGEGWVDERTLLQAELAGSSYYALNDVIVGRGGVSRLIYVDASIDGENLTTYRGDGVIVATATGSTGYSLAAGGPIMDPRSSEILLTPISPHLSLSHSLVLPSNVEIELVVRTDHQAILSIDGQINLNLVSGDKVMVRPSPHPAFFLRARTPAYFYATLTRRLNQTLGG